MLEDLSMGFLFASLVVSAIGLGFFLYGKRQGRPVQLLGGLGLMVYPIFVHSVAWMLGIGALVVGGLWFALRLGY